MFLEWKLKNLNYKLLLILIVLMITYLTHFAISKQEPHNFEGKCSSCHLVNEDGDVFEMLFVKRIDFQCNKCHNELGLSHPTGMKPTMEMPEGFPLDNRGKMTCATCHETHGEGQYLLHSESHGRALCFLCHKDGLKNIHGSAGTGAHSARRYEISDRNVLIDDVSVQCLGCHDSALGKNVNVGVGRWTHSQGRSHPIGVDYMKAYSKKRGYKHPTQLDKRVKLFNGKVGCGTCHNIYSKKKVKLVMDNNRSTLCLECHRK